MNPDRFAKQLFILILNFPKTILIISSLLLIVFTIQLPKLKTDPSPNAYIPQHHPILEQTLNDRSFSVGDPIIIGIINKSDNGVFNQKSIELAQNLVKSIYQLSIINPKQVHSIFSINNIYGKDDKLIIEQFLGIDEVITKEKVDQLKVDLLSSPLYLENLISHDGTGMLIYIELDDPALTQNTYQELSYLIEGVKLQDNSIYMSGEGAIRGYILVSMSENIKELFPISFLCIILILALVYRTLISTLLPCIIIIGSTITTYGLMSLCNIPIYGVTYILYVVIIGISVADSLYIFNEYYTQIRDRPEMSHENIIVNTMLQVLRPITLTTLTSFFGFLGIYIAEVMPPMAYLGLFCAVGVMVAYFFSLVFLPATLILFKPRPSKLFKADHREHVAHIEIRLLSKLGYFISQYSLTVFLLCIVVLSLGIYYGTQLKVDEERIRVVDKKDNIYAGYQLINSTFGGTNILHIIIDTKTKEGINNIKLLRDIEIMLQDIEKIPGVGSTSSLVDYLKQINRALHNNDHAYYRLPKHSEQISDYLLLYNLMGASQDLERYVDTNYQKINLWVKTNTGRYSYNKPIIEEINTIVEKYFNDNNHQVLYSGRIFIDHHWISLLANNHFNSILIALALILSTVTIIFRSIITASIIILPIIFSISAIYAMMSIQGIWLGISSSILATMAIGLSVSFTIHTFDKFDYLLNKQQLLFNDSIILFFVTTGRVLLFNFLTVSLGFGLLAISDIQLLANSGGLIALGVTIGFLSSITVIPVCLKLFKPPMFRQAAFSGK